MSNPLLDAGPDTGSSAYSRKSDPLAPENVIFRALGTVASPGEDRVSPANYRNLYARWEGRARICEERDQLRAALAARDREIQGLRDRVAAADQLAKAVDDAFDFFPDGVVERRERFLPALGVALVAFRAAQRGGHGE